MMKKEEAKEKEGEENSVKQDGKELELGGGVGKMKEYQG